MWGVVVWAGTEGGRRSWSVKGRLGDTPRRHNRGSSHGDETWSHHGRKVVVLIGFHTCHAVLMVGADARNSTHNLRPWCWQHSYLTTLCRPAVLTVWDSTLSLCSVEMLVDQRVKPYLHVYQQLSVHAWYFIVRGYCQEYLAMQFSECALSKKNYF